jgi:hypothetical protein
MLWKLLQVSVAGAVLSANVYFGFTQNAWIACAWAFMAAYAVTTFPFWLIDRVRAWGKRSPSRR